MKSLTGAERVFKALQLQEPDRVPFYEGSNRKIREEILPGSSDDDAVEYFDLDAVGVSDRGLPGYRIETLDASHFRNQWGTIMRVMSEFDSPHPVEGAIKTERDLDTWHPPDPDEPRRYEMLAELVKRYKGQRALPKIVHRQ